MATPTNTDLNFQVIFGTGPLGLSVMRELYAMGRRIRMINRSGSAPVPPGVEVVKGDVTDPADVRRLTKGAGVVYLCAQPPYHKWPEGFPPIINGIIEGLAGSDARLVFGDNLYMYGPVDGPLTESLPYAATGRKGIARAWVANTLLGAHRDGKLQVAIGRASDFYGPYALNSAVGERLFKAALAGKAADVLGDPDAPHTYMFISDFGKGLVTLGESDVSMGKAWHLPSAPIMTQRKFIEQVYRQAGATPRMRTVTPLMLGALGLFVRKIREVKEMMYEFDRPFIVDSSLYEKTFGSHVTPHEEAISETLEWYRSQAAKAA